VHRARHAFAAHVGAFQVGARFLPELNAIAAGLAGATKLSIMRFVLYGALSALTWAGGWIGLGYFFSHAVTQTTARLGVCVIVLVLAPFGLYLLLHRARRRHAIRMCLQGCMSPTIPGPTIMTMSVSKVGQVDFR
jgi:membrane protein DedA with SNARE-associated domain